MKNLLRILIISLLPFTLNAQVTNGLVGYFPFTDGEVWDVANVGISSELGMGNAIQNECGQSQSAWSCNNAAYAVLFQSNGLLDFGTSGSFSFVCSFKTSISGSGQLFTSRYGSTDVRGWSFGFDNAHVGKLTLKIDGNEEVSVTAATNYNDNQWHQAAVVVDRDSQLIRIYVDGVQKNIQFNDGGGTVANSNTLQIDTVDCDATPDNGGTALGRQYTGAIDEARFYNRPITAAEVAILYNARLSFTGPTLAYGFETGGYYWFNSSSGDACTPVWSCTGNCQMIVVDTYNRQISWSTPGTYTVSLICTPANPLCSADTSTYTLNINTVPTGIAEALNTESISLSPNPATTRLNINASVAIEQVSIYNTTGQLVKSFQQLPNGGIDVSSLTSGLYIAQVKTKETTLMQRWMKM